MTQERYTAVSVGTLDAVDAAQWARLAAGASFYSSWPWLRSLERDKGASATYLLAYDGSDVLRGALPVWVVEAEPSPLYRPVLMGDGRWQGPYVLAGSRRGYVNEFLAGEGEPDKAAVTRCLLAALGTVAGRGRMVVFPYLTGPAARFLARLCPDAEVLAVGVDARLELRGERFGDYLAQLPQRRRTAVRHEIADFEASGAAVQTCRLSAVQRRVAELFGQLQRKHGRADGDEHWRQVIARQVEFLDQDSAVFCCYRAGRMIGFCLGYPHGDTLYIRMAGFDYSLLKDCFEYFNTVYYTPIRFAYQHGLKCLHLGLESLEAKARRGALLQPVFSAALRQDGKDDHCSAASWNAERKNRWLERYGKWLDLASAGSAW